jgi:hypothetical protein
MSIEARNAVATTDQAEAEPKLESSTTTPTTDGSNGVAPDKGAINLLMVMSCLAFGAGSFLFGYDDKIISPVAATKYFVRVSSLCF